MPSKGTEDIIKQISDMSVKDLADLVKKLETEFDVSAAMPAAAAPVAGAGEAVAKEEKTEFKVTLKETGSEKIKVIKALRVLISGLSLTEAKEKAEGAPVVVAEAAPKEDAEKMKKLLEEAGAKVELS